jgi:hypothetical protein
MIAKLVFFPYFAKFLWVKDFFLHFKKKVLPLQPEKTEIIQS